MYTVAVRDEFEARHFLTIPGAAAGESSTHSHQYRLEVCLEGDRLDENGYLIDLDIVKAVLNKLVARYRGRTLNGLPEFAVLNPSLEHFARIICGELRRSIGAPGVTAMTVRIWEDALGWVAYREG